MTVIGSVTIAGLGPGASEDFLGVSVLDLVNSADLVIYAGVLFSDFLRDRVRGELLTGPDLEDDIIRRHVIEAYRAGKHVAWLEPGDPSLYSGEPGKFGSLSQNTAWLASSGITFRVLPGVSSLAALCARLGLEHAMPEQGTPLIVYAPARDTETVMRVRLQQILQHGFPIALFLASERIEQVLQLAHRYLGGDARVIIGYRIGWPDELILDCTINELLSRDCGEFPKHAIYLLGPWQGGAGTLAAAGECQDA